MSPSPDRPPVDPFELLTQLDPVPVVAVTDPAVQRRLDEILESVLRSDPKRSDVVVLASPRQRRRRFVASGLAVAVALTAAAFTWILTRPPSDPLSISCYAEARLDADRTQVDPDGRDARDLCSQAWARGAVDPGTTSPPPLVVCVGDGGSIAVFPDAGGLRCSRLGLAEAAADERPGGDDAATLGALQHHLVEQFLAAGCVEPARARALIDDALVRHQVRGWTVEVPAPFPAERPCGSLAFDPPTRTITVVPVPQPPGGP